jgi:hypothetical protein
MAALKVNQATKKTYSLKKLAKQRKRIGGGGDGGFLTNRIQKTLK